MIWSFLVAFTLFMGVEGLYEGIEDITNNLATDLAPLITLFGEQATKQFLSESTSFTDSIIFSIAPLGLITAVVSVIRIYGSSSFKSIIGRSQEAHGVAEAELCSSTSPDVCELWSNGGICRVFGRPKILDFIYNSNVESDFYPKYRKDRRQDIVEEGPSCGIYRPNTLFASNDKDTKKKKLFGWEEVTSKKCTWQNLFKSLSHLLVIEPSKLNDHRIEEEHGTEEEHRTRDEPSTNPNLSLNIGIRTLGKFHRRIYWLVLIFSVLLQLSFFGYAAWATFYSPSFVSEENPSPQAKLWFTLTILGTIMLVFGMILCARLIDLKSRERRFKRIRGSSKIFWLQPGGQRIGDQLFHAFAYSENRDDYITSSRLENTQRQRMLILAVISTTLGWVLQFVGLRGSPGSVALFQFIATLIMSLLRAALRGRRLGANENRLNSLNYKIDNLIEGHELDWQAMNIDENDQHCEWRLSDHFPNENQHDDKTKIPEGVTVKSTKHLRAYYTMDDDLATNAANCASEWIASQEAQNDPSLNAGAKIMRFRSRLAELTGVQFGLPPEQAWNSETRTTALQLQKALQVSAEYIFAQFPLDPDWRSDSAPKAIAWKSTCWFPSLPDKTSPEKPLPVGFQMHNRDGKWSISGYQLEAVLGLWLWSLKRSELLLGPASEEQLIRSKMVVVEKSKQDEIEAALCLWVTQTRQVREYGDVDDLSGPDNLSIPTSSLLSRAQSSKQNRDASRETNTTKTAGFTILGIPTNGSTSLLQLMAQDVYTVFINRIVDIVGDLRGTGDPEDYLSMRDHSLSTAHRATPSFELTNTHIDALAYSLVSAGIATREEALMSIVPIFLHRLKLPLLDEDMVQNLLDWAKVLRRDLKFREGAALITWMLSGCPSRFHKQGLRCLGDLYRRAALSRKRRDHEFGLNGMRDMEERYSALASDRHIQDILSCYKHLSDFFRGRKPPKVAYEKSNARRVVEAWRDRLYEDSLRQSDERGMEAPKSAEDLDLALTLSERVYLPNDNTVWGTHHLIELLRWALGRNLPELIEDLWTSASSPRMKGEPSPLTYALDCICELETLHSLLDWPGVNVDSDEKDSALGDYSRTPLICAIEANRVDVVCSILRRGAALHQRDEGGMTPLLHACQRSDMTTIQSLLDKGADIHENNDEGRKSLHFAARANSEIVIQFLLHNGADIHEKDKNGQTPLHCAAEANNEAAIQTLLENGAQTHEKDNNGQTPLHLAAADWRCKGLVRLLLEKGSDIHEKDGEGQTPLHIAADQGHVQGLIRILLEHGADVHVKDKEGRTPLHVAAANVFGLEITPLLLEKGAKICEKDRKGRTALHVAAHNGYPDILRLLLEKSAENGLVDDHGWESLWSVIGEKKKKVAQLLKEKNIKKPLGVGSEYEEEEQGENEEGEREGY